MSHRDAELSDVVVVLLEDPGMTLEQAAAKLVSEGLVVSDTNEEEGVVEGTIDSSKVKSLEKLSFVKYVRTVFNYVADFPPGDPRNLDAADDADPEEADDAGH